MSSWHSAIAYARGKHLHKWLGGYLAHRFRRVFAPAVDGTRHLLLALCDHYEPLWAADGDWEAVPDAVGMARVRRWEQDYPVVFGRYRDADGYCPRHSFFFPAEQYRPAYLEALAQLVRHGYGEVELHLHHDGDTEQGLRDKILAALAAFDSHGHLCRDEGGRLRYAFIHGDWALCNARASGNNCGVDTELPLLFDTGCFADFTFPAAPDECQPNRCNQIYWPVGDLGRRRAYEHGEAARVGKVMRDRILMIQGPLALRMRRRKMPIQIENGDINEGFLADENRARAWVAQHIHVQGRPEWVFVKLHTHGAPEQTASSLLGGGGHALHRELTGRYNDGVRWRLHYVSAREMYNIAIAAMEGCAGNPSDFRNHVLPPPAAAG